MASRARSICIKKCFTRADNAGNRDLNFRGPRVRRRDLKIPALRSRSQQQPGRRLPEARSSPARSMKRAEAEGPTARARGGGAPRPTR